MEMRPLREKVSRMVTALAASEGKLRGAVWSLLLARCGGQLRVDRGTIIRNAHQVSVGRGCWIKERVVIDGRSSREIGICLSDHVIIRTGSYLDAYGGEGFIQIGDRTGVGQYVYVGGNGGVTIGQDVMISGHAFIVAATHNLDMDTGVPYQDQGEERLGIVIEDNAWIAANVVVLDGVRIGNGAVVGAGAVVTKSIPPSVVAVGIPARTIRKVREPSRRRSPGTIDSGR